MRYLLYYTTSLAPTATQARFKAAGMYGKSVEASYRGLFGDAWLACSLTAPGERDAVLEKAGAWCVAAARAASQPAA